MLTGSRGSWAQFVFICRSHSAKELYSAVDLYSTTDPFPLHLFLWTSLPLWSSWQAFEPCFSLGFLPHGTDSKMDINIQPPEHMNCSYDSYAKTYAVFFCGLFHNSHADASLLFFMGLLFQSLLSLGKSFSFFLQIHDPPRVAKKSFSSFGWWFCCCHPKASLLQTLPFLDLLYAFLLPNSSSPVLSLGLYSCCFRLPWPISSLLGSFVPFYSFGQPRPVSSLLGSFVPFVFPWASWARLLSLGFALFLTSHHHGLLLNSLGFLDPIMLFLILGVLGLAINPLLSLFLLLWTCRNPFSLFHIIYCPWFAFSLFLGSFKLIYLLKTHLFISWAYNPLFPPLGVNEFSSQFTNSFLPILLGFFLLLGPLAKVGINTTLIQRDCQ